MRRIHLFEWADQSWVPKIIRGYFHQLLANQTAEIYQPLVQHLNQWLAQQSPTQPITDLASGGGGPWPQLQQQINWPAGVRLSDLNPQPHQQLPMYQQPVDLTQAASWPQGPLTLFTGFHHLTPAQAQTFLADIAQRQQPLFIGEFTQRKLSTLIGMLLSPLVVWAQTASIKPREPLRLLLTYLLPVIPLIYLWDGMVSHLRTYTLQELQQMASQASTEQYQFKVFSHKHPKFAMTLSGIIGTGVRS